MFQKEVAERLAAPPGSAAYGRLSVIAQRQAVVKALFDVPARAFHPAAQSGFPRWFACCPARRCVGCRQAGFLETVTAAAFGQRRKRLRSSLKSLVRRRAAPARGKQACRRLRAPRRSIRPAMTGSPAPSPASPAIERARLSLRRTCPIVAQGIREQEEAGVRFPGKAANMARRRDFSPPQRSPELVGVGSMSPAAAQSAAEFYKSINVTLVVGSGAGGGLRPL